MRALPSSSLSSCGSAFRRPVIGAAPVAFTGLDTALVRFLLLPNPAPYSTTQVQFLQRESVDRPLSEARSLRDNANGNRVGDGGGGGAHGGLRLADESPGFASLFDARLVDERHLQVLTEIN